MRKMKGSLSHRNFWLILVVTAIMLTAFPFLVRPFSQQSNNNPSSPQPFTFFILPETSTFSEPTIPILVAVILPSELSQNYQLSDFFVISEGLFVPTFPLFEEPFFDSETNSFVWLFAGLFDASEILQPSLPINLTLSAHSFFEPLEPSLSPLSSFDQISITISLPQIEESQEEAKGKEGTSSKTEKKPLEENQKVSEREGEKGETGKDSSASKVSRSKVQSAKEAVLKDPNASRKAFEQEIAAKALSNAKKNPKSTAKGNGIIITVGAYPEVLPADGKSTAFIVAKVTDEKGKPIAGKEVSFSSTGGQVLVKAVKTDEQGLAFSRICSELLQKGQRKVVKVRAKVNPEAEAEVIFDGDMVLTLDTSNVSVYAFCYWKKITPNGNWVCTPKPPYCEGKEENGVSGLAGIAMHVITPLGYWTAYPNYIEVIGDGHPNQFRSDYNRNYFDYDQNAPCPPPPDPSNPNQQRFRFSWHPETTLGWVEFHRSLVTIKINYTVGRYYPYPPQFWTETKTFVVNAVNTVLKIDPSSPEVLAFDPENPDQSKLTVKFEVETLQIGRVWVWMRIYSCGRGNNEGPTRVIQTETTTNTPTLITWDGRKDNGEVAEKGLYAYDLAVCVEQISPECVDRDVRVSKYLWVERAVDEEGREIFEAEYYGYDDKGTEEESDDEHIFLVRYGLRCGSAMLDDDGDFGMRAFVDEDSDGRLDEDWMDGIDNDNDGRIDEDPPGYCDEDWKDGVDNDKDGLVDEDPPNPVDASAGYILVYDPDLEPLRDEQGKIRRIDISSLPCVVHEETDGLHANLEGVYHGVLVRLPVSFMQKAGEYRFVIQAYDNHAHLHKDHQVKPALELNAEWKVPKLPWAPMRQGQKFGDNPGNGKPNTAIGKRIFPDLPVPPDQLPPNEDREAYRKAKVIVHVWGEPNTTKTVYLRLLDPDDPSAPDTQEELPMSMFENGVIIG
jgi:hypothetical protein